MVSKCLTQDRYEAKAQLNQREASRRNNVDRVILLPMNFAYHWIPGDFHPLKPVNVVVKTKDAGLRGAIAPNTITIIKKKRMFATPPASSSCTSIFLAKMLHSNGSTITAPKQIGRGISKFLGHGTMRLRGKINSIHVTFF